MYMLGAGAIISIILIYIVVFFISILLIRWLFRINDIVGELETIRKLLQKGALTATTVSPSTGLDQKTAQEPITPSPEDKLESLRVRFNQLGDRILASKNEEEKTKLKKAREQVQKEIFLLRNKLDKW
jgi:hypothetical protein